MLDVVFSMQRIIKKLDPQNLGDSKKGAKALDKLTQIV